MLCLKSPGERRGIANLTVLQASISNKHGKLSQTSPDWRSAPAAAAMAKDRTKALSLLQAVESSTDETVRGKAKTLKEKIQKLPS
jgi:hypothetical protein